MIKVSKIVVYKVGVIANPDINNYEDFYIGNLELTNRKEIAAEVAENYNLGDIYQNSNSTNTSTLNFQVIKEGQIYQVKAKTDED